MQPIVVTGNHIPFELKQGFGPHGKVVSQEGLEFDVGVLTEYEDGIKEILPYYFSDKDIPENCTGYFMDMDPNCDLIHIDELGKPISWSLHGRT